MYESIASMELLALVGVCLLLVSSRMKTEYRHYLTVVVIGLYFGLAWMFVLMGIPDNWLGLQDGYLYSMFIKTYRWTWIPYDALSTHLASYPFYFFYLFGRLSALLGIDDPGQAYRLAIIVTYTVSPIIVAYIMKQVFGWNAALVSSVLLISIYVIADIGHVYQKPHEVISISILYPLTAAVLSEKYLETSRRSRFAFGCLAGLAFGMYTPLVVSLLICFIFSVIVVTTVHGWHAVRWIRDNVVDMPTLIGSVIVGMPWLVIYLYGVLLHGIGPHVAYENVADSDFGFISLNRRGIFYISSIVILAYAVSSSRPSKQLLGLVGLFHLGYFSLYVLRDSLATSIFKYHAAVLGIAMIAFSVLLTFDRKRLTKILIIVLLVVYAPIFYSHIMDKRSRFEYFMDLSWARENNDVLQTVASLLDKEFGSRRFVYLANYEFRFVNYYTKGAPVPYLYHNHTYISAYEDRLKQIDTLKRIIQENDYEGFLSFLKARDIELLALTEKGGVYPLQLIVNERFIPDGKKNNQRIEILNIPIDWINRLQQLENTKTLFENAKDKVVHILW